ALIQSKSKMRRLAYISGVIAGLLLLSCGGRDYSHWTNLPAEGWVYGDTVLLDPLDSSLPDNDSLVGGALKLALRHGNSYQYSNIWLEMTYRTDDRRMIRDTINLPLADIYGRWLGSGFGASYQQEILVSPQTTIDLTRPVALRHIMRVDTLAGVEQIGIEIVR
ncbi:MAG: gliding motility lipoprotein GldH, partial [Duncaniella sp.]|nr:gliding motility lipoprotein GldH [Duncaniella sp.]